MIIREATEADLPILEELVLAYLDEHWARPYPQPPPGPYIAEGQLVVAEVDGNVAGTCCKTCLRTFRSKASSTSR